MRVEIGVLCTFDHFFFKTFGNCSGREPRTLESHKNRRFPGKRYANYFPVTYFLANVMNDNLRLYLDSKRIYQRYDWSRIVKVAESSELNRGSKLLPSNSDDASRGIFKMLFRPPSSQAD